MGFRDLVGFTVEEIDPGVSLGRLEVTEDHLNGGGRIVHGGAIATLCDSAMGRAVVTSLGEGMTSSTASLTVTYMASAEPGDVLIAHGKVRKGGRRVIVVEVDVVREHDEREIAHAIATFVAQPRIS